MKQDRKREIQSARNTDTKRERRAERRQYRNQKYIYIYRQQVRHQARKQGSRGSRLGRWESNQGRKKESKGD